MSDTIHKLVQAEIALEAYLAEAKSKVGLAQDEIETIHGGVVELLMEINEAEAEKAALIAALNVASANHEIPIPFLVHDITKENKGWGDTKFYKATELLSILKDQVIVCGGRSGILNAKGQSPFEADWDNLTFVQGRYATGWGAQLNKAYGSIRNSTFLRLGDSSLTEDSGHKDGHPLYIKPDGIFSFIGNKFLECQGNVQLAARPWEGDDLDFADLTFSKNTFVSNAWSPYGHGGGGASNLALYCASDQGTLVEVTDNVYNCSIPYPGQAGAKSGASARGFLTIWNEAFYPSQGRINQGAVKDPDKHFKSAIVTGNTIRSEAADRPFIQIQGCEEIIIEENEISIPSYEGNLPYPVIRIDHDASNPVQAKKIVIKPVDIPGDIQVGSIKVPLKQGFEYQSAGYTPHTL